MIESNFLEDLYNRIRKGGAIEDNVKIIFNEYNCNHIYQHSVRVAQMAENLAIKFKVDKNAAYIAGLLHDIGGIVPNNERIHVGQLLNVNLLPEEREFPMIIHQKISKVIAEEIFFIKDQKILEAIECHTTLRANPSLLDHVVFVADKIEWDQNGIPPYIDDLHTSLSISIENASFSYVDFLMRRKERLKVIHPWLSESYIYLKER
ncbi:bis(5'-nucleosyl)-tetraphosphatase (symmetrical) YqeK [Gracilibacillus sp. S3-1-1]|uniref:Bis(5'-nucleosyl)-tetraphosphatase (Symmetrical) YqeK n=1 Tax=Gracilibacillus pellucidus TaxID=3095368 RepID=A0ACC6M8C3_9BACI|nr:bis(5'-nucleosyl)-tetraphosphatase (symmetrical) YqeK [Gracilibacillus sp. S3-1-1]MDX8047189.1 bis(5'-nucleosyl)-tetraphosphatase (symmetrical) YqeK [Gracilibacillus sp. S3-1-1]